jgi:putative phosphotransacetylase
MASGMKTRLPVAMSDIHVHLTRASVDALFGTGHLLSPWRDLTIPGQFACHETVTVCGPSGSVAGAVVVGPERPYTQVEVSLTNASVLGIAPPRRLSGDLAGTPGCTLEGPCGRLELQHGVIAALRHIHMHTRDAAEFGVTDGQHVRIRVPGDRGLVFENVVVRAGPNEALEMHIDMDEGRAAGIIDFQLVELLPD